MQQDHKTLLTKQGYQFIGEHSACKTCHYTKQSIKNSEECYKQKFYGIKSHQCIQMSVAVNFCNMDCLFCWRSRTNSNFGKIDEPENIVQNAITAQKKLLSGLKGDKKTNLKKWNEARKPKHFAISLNGENTAYPKLDQFIKTLHEKGYTSFLVTNGQLPTVLERITMPTQLYISLSTPNKELFNAINRPMHKDGWERLMRSLEIMKEKKSKTRTAIRMTIIKNLTDVNPEQYAKLIKKANPKFVEVKSYSWLGASKTKLKRSQVMTMEEVRNFAEQIGKHCGYEKIDEQESGRIVLLMEKDTEDRIMKF